MSLSARLREETKEAHVRAERSPFMQRVFKGTVSREGYADLLAGLLPVYVALEEGLAHAPEAVRALHPPALHRAGALVRDLAVFAAGSPEATEAPRAGRALAARIRQTSGTPEDGAHLLLAHAYVRYLGDLSGGQILGRLVSKTFALEGPAGTAFYRFPRIPDPEAFKEAYREGLDALELGPEQADETVEEACHAFALHQALFEELEEREVARTG